MEIRIEPYQDQDFKKIIHLVVSSFESKFVHRLKLDLDDIQSMLCSIWAIKAEDPGYLHMVAKYNEEIVGVIQIRYASTQPYRPPIPLLQLSRQYGFFNTLLLLCKLAALEESHPDDCYIEHIAVAQRVRGSGIGEQLIAYSERLLICRGYETLALTVASNNAAARLYYRKGFKIVRHVRRSLTQWLIGNSHWIVMRKYLS